MAYKVVWSLAALDELESIADFIAVDSARNAKQFVEEALHSAASLTLYPLRGRHSSVSRDPSIRELFLGQYRLMYRVENDHVIIRNVLHMARQPGLT